jgi:hypothetical protein
MKHAFLGLALLMSTAFITSCASLGGHFDPARAQNVKKVAVVGFEILQSMPTDNMGIGKMLDYKEHSGVNNSVAIQTMAKGTYEDFAMKLGKTTKWKVLSFDDLVKNKTYATKVETAMSGVREISMGAMQQGKELITAKGMLDVTAFRKMKPEERTALAKALGVDAVAELVVIQTIDQPMFALGHVSGDASFDYKTRLNFTVFEPAVDAPVWRIQNVDGEKFSSKSMPEGTIRIDKISKVSLLAAQSASTKLVEQYPSTVTTK